MIYYFRKGEQFKNSNLPIGDRFHSTFLQLHVHRQCFIELKSDFRFISVIIAMLLVNIMPRVFASFDVQLKFESLLGLMFELLMKGLVIECSTDINKLSYTVAT